MLKLKLRPKATEDLESIFEFTYSNWGIEQATKYQDELFNSMINICKNPKIGGIYYFKEGGFRKLNINKHLIFYRILEQEIIITRILHQRMDLRSVHG